MSDETPLMGTTSAELESRWRDYLLERYHHYSGKVVNSNSTCGVRLGREHALDLPHLSGRTLLAGELDGVANGGGLELDYIAQPPSTHAKQELGVTSPNKQLGEWIKGEPGNSFLSTTQIADLVSLFEGMRKGEFPGTFIPDPLPLRLKQLLLPRGDGSFVSVTPLPSLQVAKSLNEYCRGIDERRNQLYKNAEKLSRKKRRTEDEDALLQSSYDAIKRLPRFSRLVEMPVGGGNPQNVGGHAKVFQKPVVFDALPTSTADQRRSFGIVYNGLRFYLPQKLVARYRDFLNGLRAQYGDPLITWTVPMIEAEEPYLNALMASWCRQAAHARDLLKRHSKSLPSPYPYQSCSDDAGRFNAWLGLSEQTHAWKKSEASRFAKALSSVSLGVSDQGEVITLGLSDADVRRIANSVQKGGVL